MRAMNQRPPLLSPWAHTRMSRSQHLRRADANLLAQKCSYRRGNHHQRFGRDLLVFPFNASGFAAPARLAFPQPERPPPATPEPG